MKAAFLVLTLAAGAVTATAAPVAYEVDPTHTYPSFEADHLGGLSVWRGKMEKSKGTVMLDKAAGAGEVDIEIDLDSIDFGNRQLNNWAIGDKFFDTKNNPKARYKGTLAGFVDGKPTKVNGQLTMKGVTKPVELTIASFKCMPHPLSKRDLCGADAMGSFDRDDFGLGFGKEYGFRTKVDLRIQVEAVATN